MNTKQILQTTLTITLATIFIATGFASSIAFGQAAKAEQPLSELAWLSGGWRTAAGGQAQIEEHWMSPAGGSMLGMSRAVAGDKMVEFEFIRIEQRADAIYYIASPKGRCPGTDFKLTRLSGEEAVFENPRHDFPKRIVYRKNADGSLVASIDGGAGTKSQTFSYLPIAK